MLYLREKGQARCDRPADIPLLHQKRGVSCVAPLLQTQFLEPDVSNFRSPLTAISKVRRLLLAIALVATLAGACGSPSVTPTAPPPSASASPSQSPVVVPSATAAASFPARLTDDEGTAVTVAT